MGKKFVGLDGLKHFWQKIKTKIEESQKIVTDEIAKETTARENADIALQTAIDGKSDKGHTHTKSEITDFAHTHDDRYFTETEITNKLAGKSDTGHTHDDRYYTETEIDTKLSNKVDKVSGKGLSTNDYTTEEKNKLSGLDNYDDTAVKSSITDLQTQITSNKDAIETEAVAREAGDTALENEITTEVTRATTAENNLSTSISSVSTNLSSHTGNKSNPHGVTKSQVGLGNVPNVATNDQTPTYTEASKNTALTSGEKLSVAFGKIAKAISSLISHLTNKSNPHEVTKAQVGLGNVVNTGDSATPTSGGTTKFTTGGAYTLKQAIDKNTTAIATLNGTGTGSVTKTVSDKIAEVVAGAPESLDTLKEISDWIDTHEDSASAMNTAIQANATAISDEAKARAAADTALQTAINGKAASSHTHDDRYYTESEIDTKLSGKANSSHTHTKSQITDFAHTHTKSQITDFAHNHDDRYYTESEIDTKLSGKADTSHKHSASDITSGTLAVARGGTGQTTAKAAANTFINSLEIDTDTPVDADYYVAQYANGGTTNTTYYRRPVSKLWDYIKGKISSVLGLTATAYGGKASTAGTADKTVNDISINIPYVTEHTQYVILLGNIPEPTSTERNSPYNWDVCGQIDAIRPAGHQVGHIHFFAGHGYSHSWRTYVDCDYIGYTGIAGYPSPLDIKCFQYDGKWWLGIQMILGHSSYSCKAHITYKRNAPTEFLTAIPYYSSYTKEVYNEEINSSIQDVPSDWLIKRVWQNSIQAPTFIGALNGNASTATRATQDASGNVITDAYATKTDLSRGLSGKSDTGHTHDYASSSHTHTKSQINDFPTSLKNPNALTFGSKTYDGSAAKTITAADLGALTQHQPVDRALSATSENPIQNKAVFEALMFKADKGDKLSDYGIIDAYTREETNSLLSGVMTKSTITYDSETATLTISLVE